MISTISTMGVGTATVNQSTANQQPHVTIWGKDDATESSLGQALRLATDCQNCAGREQSPGLMCSGCAAGPHSQAHGDVSQGGGRHHVEPYGEAMWSHMEPYGAIWSGWHLGWGARLGQRCHCASILLCLYIGLIVCDTRFELHLVRDYELDTVMMWHDKCHALQKL